MFRHPILSFLIGGATTVLHDGCVPSHSHSQMPMAERNCKHVESTFDLFLVLESIKYCFFVSCALVFVQLKIPMHLSIYQSPFFIISVAVFPFMH